MSAFVVDKAHINAMIDAGLSVRYRPMHWYPEGKEGSSSLTEINASEVGQMLLEECIKSVGYRYEDSKITDLPGRSDAEYLIPFQYHLVHNIPNALHTIAITKCYMYQSCEHPEWEQSEACTFCQALISNKIADLPGYDDAPWDWDDPEYNTPTLVRLI